MTDIEINTFIESMEELGDEWEFEDAKRVYGDKTLDEALDDRRGSIAIMGNILNMVSNR